MLKLVSIQLEIYFKAKYQIVTDKRFLACKNLQAVSKILINSVSVSNSTVVVLTYIRFACELHQGLVLSLLTTLTLS